MIAIHAIWTGGALDIWGEDSERILAAGARGRGAKGVRPHPFAMAASVLQDAVRSFAGDGQSGPARSASLSLRLPSMAARPLASPDLLAGGAPADGARTLEAWRVPCLEWPASDALRLLVGLPVSPSHGIVFGASLRYWGEAAKLSLELLAQGLFVPDAKEAEGGGLTTRWMPALWEADIPQRRRLLVLSLPPVCRAHLDGGKQPSSPNLVDSFLTGTVDAFVRQALDGRLLLAGDGRGRGAKDLPHAWLEALSAAESRAAASANQSAPFLKELRAWTAQLVPRADGASFRTCFRLEPPDDAGEGKKRRKPSPWRVTFHLQALDDRSLLIDADRVWTERSATLSLLGRRIEDPQERLLGDLGRASRVFPAIESGLKSPRPTSCELDTEGAYGFLREAAPLLEQSGFGVLAPSWWTKPSARLGVRVRVKQKGNGKAANSGLLGMDSLVSVDWQAALGDQPLTADELERLATLKVPLVQVRGQWVELKPEEVEAALRFFQKRAGSITLADALRLGLTGEAVEGGLPVVSVEATGRLKELMRNASDGARIKVLPPPEGFRGTLRPYQLKGLSWLAFLDRFGLGGCLADDMGLGKTVQLIALLLHERAGGAKPGPTLLIAPMSVVGNWRREAEKFAPALKVMVHHGAGRLSGRAFVRAAKRHDIVISSYALVQRDREHLAKVRWQRVALDEAQNIKNPSAKQAQAVRSLDAARRVALTGTPVENRLSDLWSIMEFLDPGYLGPAERFRRRFATPIEKYRDAEQMSRLRRLVGPFMLRRLKTDPAVIQDLPQKMEMKVFCTLTKEQASLYEAVLKEMMGRVDESEGIERRGKVLATLTKLKQACDHPALLLQDGSALPGRSGKLQRLVEMLEEVVEEGDRALVFTQFAEMGIMLKPYLQDALMREVLFLHGGTPRSARDEMVQRFQSDGGAPPVFILSLKAGGLGLNLTAANHVFHFDRWWNPAVENQATDRAFRIGQKKNVQVHKYICAGTLEDNIDKLIESKRELAEGVVGTGEGWLTELSSDQLRELLALSRQAVVEG